mgnify:CR=1 FL=1
MKVGDLVEVDMSHLDFHLGSQRIFKTGLVTRVRSNNVVTVTIVGEQEGRIYRYFGLEELRVISEVG